MFHNHIFKYLYLKIPTFFSFWCFVIPQNIKKLDICESKILKYASIYLGTKETTMFAKCVLRKTARKRLKGKKSE